VTQTDRQLLLAAADGDLSAAYALIDRLEELNDTRLNDTRRIIGKLINGVLDTWQDDDCADFSSLDYETRVVLASERVGMLDQARHDLFELFFVELIKQEDVAKISQQLADAANLLKEDFPNASVHDIR